MDFTSWIIIVTTWLTLGESFNCIYPRLEDDYDSKGFICKWDENDFYYDKLEDALILFPEDSTDNYFESKARERYWRKR